MAIPRQGSYLWSIPMGYDPFPDTPENRKLRYEQYQSFANLSHWSVIDATRSEDVVFRDIMFNIDLPSVEGN